MNDLLLGARLAVAGGRDGWTRAVLTAVGVGIGVAMLLMAAAVPGALQARHDRTAARDDMRLGEQLPSADNTVLVGIVDTTYREAAVRGRLVRPEGPRAPTPPGVSALPGPGEVVVSPALADLLASPDGALLRPRLPGRVTGTIGAAGLSGPRELAYYAGTDDLRLGMGQIYRLDAFGGGSPGEGFGPVLTLLIIVIFVVLLLPIAVFLGAAVRFGGERRDRRLAALRLVGADAAMTRRIAAGEAAAGVLLGLAVGGALFAAGRRVVPLVSVWDISVYAEDVRPNPVLVLLVALAVPVVAVAVSLIALRRTVIEPLGVVRSAATARRRAWWRFVLPALGLLLFLPASRAAAPVSGDYAVAAGAILLLFGVAALLPWLIEQVVRRLRGGSLPWQLAIRRLQLDSGTSARLVSGIAVAVAGTIGLQMLFTGVEGQFSSDTGQDLSRAHLHVRMSGLTAPDSAAALDKLAATPGVVSTIPTMSTLGSAGTDPGSPGARILIADCAALAEFAAVGRCANGDVFLVNRPDGGIDLSEMRPGRALTFDDSRPKWTLPAGTRTAASRPDPLGIDFAGILATPGAVPAAVLPPVSAEAFVKLDPARRDALEQVRNTITGIDPFAGDLTLSGVSQERRFVNVRRGLYIGIVVTLLLIGASMLVGVTEQLRERRRLLAMLVAVGTPRRTLGMSVLWQTVVPVVLGLGLAVAFGVGLGAVLLRLVDEPFGIYWSVVAGSTGLAAVVVLLVTALSLPALWRLIRPEGLRTE